jgi:hypothetical protein
MLFFNTLEPPREETSLVAISTSSIAEKLTINTSEPPSVVIQALSALPPGLSPRPESKAFSPCVSPTNLHCRDTMANLLLVSKNMKENINNIEYVDGFMNSSALEDLLRSIYVDPKLLLRVDVKAHICSILQTILCAPRDEITGGATLAVSEVLVGNMLFLLSYVYHHYLSFFSLPRI